MTDIHQAFKMGAMQLAANQCEYSNLHKGHGIDQYDWDILTQSEYWSPEQARNMRSVIANVVEVSMTIAGMPAIPLPGHYVAALIATVVAPCNRMVACVKAPDTFDGAIAAGIESTHQVKEMSVQQLMALVLAYSGGYPGEPQPHKLPKQVAQQMQKVSKK